MYGYNYRQKKPVEVFLDKFFFPTLVLSLVVVIAWLFIAVSPNNEVRAERHQVRYATDQNEFWQMLATGETSEEPLGLFAAELQEPFTSDNPAKALSETYIEPGTHSEIQRSFSYPLFVDDPDISGDGDYGYLSPEFVVQAVQATPDNLSDLRLEAPEVGDVGWRNWQNMLFFSLAPVTLYLLSALLILVFTKPWRSIQKRKKAKQKQKEFATLPGLAQDALLIKERLQKMPQTTEVRTLLQEAEVLYKRALSEAESNPLDQRSDVQRTRADITQLRETMQLRSKVYKDLSRS